MRSEQFCTFYLDGLFFGVAVKTVQEVLQGQDLTPVPLAPVNVGGLINLRGQIVTAVDLRHRLGLRKRADDIAPMNVVVRGEEGVVSLLVDTIGDVLDVVEEDFEVPPDTLHGPGRQFIDGAYKLKGKLMLVLNTERAVASPA